MDDQEQITVLSGGVHIPAKLCQMTFEHFNGVFEVFIQDPDLTYEEAYEMVEKAHKKIFEKERYPGGYESFRRVRGRKIKDGTLSQ